jgi:hypothetical protein
LGGATGSAGGRRCCFTGRGRRCWKKKKPEGKGEWPLSVFGGEDDGEENGAGLREEEDAGTGWRGRRKMKACAGKGVRLVFGKERGSGRLWEMTGCGLKGKCWPCLGREDGEAASKNGLSGRFLRKKIKAGWGRRL